MWRGSPGELAAAARAVQAEIDQIQTTEEDGFQSLVLNFADDSRQDFGTVDEMETAMEGLSPAEVCEFNFFFCGSGETSVSISGSRRGIEAGASGSLGFASGAVATVKSRLSGGVKAGERAAKVSMGIVDWIFWCAAAIALAAGVGLSMTGAVRELGAAILGALVGCIGVGVYAFVVEESHERRKPPPFALVEEGKQFGDEGDRSGPVWRAKAWFERHPAVGFVLTLILGAALGRAADLI